MIGLILAATLAHFGPRKVAPFLTAIGTAPASAEWNQQTRRGPKRVCPRVKRGAPQGVRQLAAATTRLRA